jgi:CheY-like chemotaxis protein
MEKKDFKILIVDDEADWRTTNKKTLEHEGYAVIVAASGQEGPSAWPPRKSFTWLFSTSICPIWTA